MPTDFLIEIHNCLNQMLAYHILPFTWD